jgi:hydrogenase expression/formation protein HypC
MCLALPARVVALGPAEQATVELGGVRQVVSVALTPEVRVGDYVIVHVGHAIGTLDADEAERTLALLAELAAHQATQAAGDPAAGLATRLAMDPTTAPALPPAAHPDAAPARGPEGT